MKKLTIVFVTLLTLAFSCSSEQSPTCSAKVWIESFDSAGSVDVNKEIDAKLELLNLMAGDSFAEFESFSISNHEGTSTFDIVITDADTAKSNEALNLYIDMISNAYNVQIIEAPHAQN